MKAIRRHLIQLVDNDKIVISTAAAIFLGSKDTDALHIDNIRFGRKRESKMVDIKLNTHFTRLACRSDNSKAASLQSVAYIFSKVDLKFNFSRVRLRTINVML